MNNHFSTRCYIYNFAFLKKDLKSREVSSPTKRGYVPEIRLTWKPRWPPWAVSEHVNILKPGASFHNERKNVRDVWGSQENIQNTDASSFSAKAAVFVIQNHYTLPKLSYLGRQQMQMKSCENNFTFVTTSHHPHV